MEKIVKAKRDELEHRRDGLTAGLEHALKASAFERRLPDCVHVVVEKFLARQVAHRAVEFPLFVFDGIDASPALRCPRWRSQVVPASRDKRFISAQSRLEDS